MLWERGLGCVQAMAVVVAFGSTEIGNTTGNKREVAKSRMGGSDFNSCLISKYIDRCETTKHCCSCVVSESNEAFQLKAGR